MALTAVRHSILALATTGLLCGLSGCVETAGGGLAPFAPAAASKPGGDVEAPEVFQVTDTALWDGRPSLGGIWVASPDAVDPERVIMENLATGLVVQGALFRRERDNPGPTLQISSDAAEALGILAGQPVEIRVTALRRAEPEVPVQAEEPGTDPATPEAVADQAPVAQDTGEGADATAAVAAAALAEADFAPADPEAGGAPVAEAVPLTAKERRAEAKAAREAKKAAAKAEAEAAKAAAAGVATADEGSTVDAGDVAAVETAPLDARAPEVSAAAAAAADQASEPPADKAPTETPAKADATDAANPAEDAPVVATTARAIQIATFSQEENATRALATLAKIGVTARVAKTEVGGKPVWGIMATGDVATLKSIRGAGFADAYFLQ